MHDKKCDKLLKDNSCLTKKVFCYYSKQHRLGNGSLAVSTAFYLNYNDKKYKVTTNQFWKPIPVGTPIMVRFSPKCPDCAEILWDYEVRQNGYQIRYKQQGEEVYVFEKEKLQLLTICNMAGGGFSGLTSKTSCPIEITLPN